MRRFANAFKVKNISFALIFLLYLVFSLVFSLGLQIKDLIFSL